jgi:hypothetical protein
MRVSDADRDRVLTELGEHFQAGRLTSDELEERTGKALAAKTVGDLSGLVSDLPALHPPAPPPVPAPMPGVPVRRFQAVASAVVAVAFLAVVLLAARDGHHNVGWGAIIPILIVVRILVGGHGRAGRRRW